MKNIYTSVIAFVLIATISSCSEDSTPAVPKTVATPGSMTAKVDGNSWTADPAGATIIQGKINITGVATDGSTITMTLNGDSEGEYSLDLGSAGAGVYKKEAASNSYLSHTNANAGGSVTITSINSNDKKISGTFSFKGINSLDMSSVEITEGTFTEIEYTTEVSGGSGNSLSADIDGTTWTAPSVNAFIALGRLSVVGTDGSGSKTISITLPQDVKVGTFDLTAFGDYVGQYNKSATVFLTADEGKVNITKHDVSAKKIEGTFTFEASDFFGNESASITNGSFSVSY